MADLAVVTNSSTSIAIKTADYAAGAGNFYVWYAAAPATGHTARGGEGSLYQLYHGKAGFLATGSVTDNSDATQLGAGWDSSNNDAGLLTLDIELAKAAGTGTGAAFALSDPNNTCMMTVHTKGATANYVVDKYWTVWANGIHAVAAKNRASVAAGSVFFETGIRTSYITGTGSGYKTSATVDADGFSGTDIGVMRALSASTPTSSPSSEARNDNNAFTLGFFTSAGTMAAGSITTALLAFDGYEGASTVTATLVTQFALDYTTHSGTSRTLVVSTGTKTSGTNAGTDRYGTAVTWTDGFDPQRGAWVIGASSNRVVLGGSTAASWGIDGTVVVTRFRPRFIITGWTDTRAPAVTLGGSAQTPGTDYDSYVDTANHTLYLCLLKDIAGTEGALSLSAPVYLGRRNLGLRSGSRGLRSVA